MKQGTIKRLIKEPNEAMKQSGQAMKQEWSFFDASLKELNEAVRDSQR